MEIYQITCRKLHFPRVVSHYRERPNRLSTSTCVTLAKVSLQWCAMLRMFKRTLYRFEMRPPPTDRHFDRYIVSSIWIFQNHFNIGKKRSYIYIYVLSNEISKEPSNITTYSTKKITFWFKLFFFFVFIIDRYQMIFFFLFYYHEFNQNL